MMIKICIKIIWTIKFIFPLNTNVPTFKNLQKLDSIKNGSDTTNSVDNIKNTFEKLILYFNFLRYLLAI